MFKNVAKGGIATAAIGAMALTGALAGATPAQARDRDGISTGDVVAGALIIGGIAVLASAASKDRGDRSEEHTSELQPLMRISYAVFCLKKKRINTNKKT